jgi:phage terminase large subunit GpA-like protein
MEPDTPSADWHDPDEAAKVAALREAWRAGWALPPAMTLPEWADTYRRLAPEAGAIAGAWQTSRVEIARGPMLAVTEPGVHTVTVMTCTQLLKTSLLENIIGYHAHLDPCPMLLVEPKDEAAEQYSKERITPFVRVTPVLANLIGTTKRRQSKETLLYKAFPGGFLALAGAGSPDNLARRPVRIVLCDEVDRYPVTREGDPIALAEERTATFGVNWLSVRAGSPTVEDESRIEKCWLDSDQRRASLVCPHCGHRLFPEFFRHVQWDREAGQHLPQTARIYCEACGAAWSEGQRLMALATARWHQTRAFMCCGRLHVPLDLYEQRWRTDESPSSVDDTWDWWEGDRHAVYRAKCPECGRWGVDNAHAGFHARKLYSPWQKDRPADIAAKWLAAHDDEDLKQTWWNTQEGLAYRAHAGKELRLEALQSRGEVWAGQVPDGVGALTAGLDVQDDRVECEIVGWGRNEESWSVDYSVFDGDPQEVELWDRIDAHLKRIWLRADGRPFALLAACIDSGHCTQRVYEFCRARLGRHIWAVKGESARSGQRSPVWPVKKPTRKNKGAFRPVIIGVNAAKDTIRARLHIANPGAGYMHFPADRDIGYFAQLTAEVPEVKMVAGHRFRVWVLPRGKANEALDCRVYAYAGLCGLFHFGLHLNRRTEALAAAPENPVPVVIDRVSAEASPATLPAASQQGAPVPAPVKPAGPAVRTVATKEAPVRRSIASRLA